MTTHVSARIAWHNDGWNGHICRNPRANVYCVGRHSFPGQTIAESRNLEWEEANAGAPLQDFEADQNQLPPCTWSINAFGGNPMWGFTTPPAWFRDDTRTKFWQLLPYTVSVWPYEEMYNDAAINPSGTGKKFNAEKRRDAANKYFDQIEEHKSLIFYYANYSNPFTEEENQRYVLVGLSRIKDVGTEITWDDQSEKMREDYGGYVWARTLTSHYPDEGLRIPYSAYADRPDVLEKIVLYPENPRVCKYATRHVSDDEALGLIEQFQQVVATLIEVGDKSENWQARLEWLSSLTADLWNNRGLYPGLLRILDYLKFSEAIPFAKYQIHAGYEKEIKAAIFPLIEAQTDTVEGLAIDAKRLDSVRKRWKLLTEGQQRLLRDILPKFDLQVGQVENILNKPEAFSIYASHEKIYENPFLLAEQYVGVEPDDFISFNKIERGLYPSPELGEFFSFEPDDWRRLRALMIEQLKLANQHTFVQAAQVLKGLNDKLSILPDWKRVEFNARYLEVYKDELGEALVFRLADNDFYVYLRSVYEDERIIEETLRSLAARTDLELRASVKEGDWKNFLTDPKSDFARGFPNDYEEAINQQISVCQKVFLKPLSVLCGSAGTGKTTIVKALIQAIERGHGRGASFQLLAPTGKAADRLRERTGKEAATLHSFLAQRGWLNDNFTLRPNGTKEAGFSTYIIDEASMLDLPLLATFFRSVNWNSVQRLIFVGDPSQLPPIGTGKVYADLVDWLNLELPQNIGMLETNIRQIQNRLTKRGTGIIDVASLFIRQMPADEKSADQKAQEEQILQLVQDGGEVSGDLRVLYWQNPKDLEQILLDTIIADMVTDTETSFDPERPNKLFDNLFNPDGICEPEKSQVMSPYRSEEFGVDYLNQIIQRFKNRWLLENKGQLGGITYWDKVIQIRNRPKSNPARAYNVVTRQQERVEVYNGEIGYTRVHGLDNGAWKRPGFRLGRFQTAFSRKRNFWVNFETDGEVEDNLELAYVISVHKAQGSEFNRVYFILPKHKRTLLTRELFYTGITRATTHCTLLIEEDISPVLTLRRPESSQIVKINSSLFAFRPVSPELLQMRDWYEEGKIHRTLTEHMVRSKSEVIIANMLADREIPFMYEVPLRAPDGTFYLPDFTIQFRGEIWYWEHLGMLHNERYRNHWEQKQRWYEKHGFSNRLITTEEGSGFDSFMVLNALQKYLGI